MLRGVDVRSPKDATARPNPQYPVRCHESPSCDPPLQLVNIDQGRDRNRETCMVCTNAMWAVLLKSKLSNFAIMFSCNVLALRK